MPWATVLHYSYLLNYTVPVQSLLTPSSPLIKHVLIKHLFQIIIGEQMKSLWKIFAYSFHGCFLSHLLARLWGSLMPRRDTKHNWSGAIRGGSQALCSIMGAVGHTKLLLLGVLQGTRWEGSTVRVAAKICLALKWKSPCATGAWPLTHSPSPSIR